MLNAVRQAGQIRKVLTHGLWESTSVHTIVRTWTTGNGAWTPRASIDSTAARSWVVCPTSAWYVSVSVSCVHDTALLAGHA